MQPSTAQGPAWISPSFCSSTVRCNGDWRRRPLGPDLLTPLPVPEGQSDYAPSAGWRDALTDLRKT